MARVDVTLDKHSTGGRDKTPSFMKKPLSSPEILHLGHYAQDPYPSSESNFNSFLSAPIFSTHLSALCSTCGKPGHEEYQCPLTHLHCTTCGSSNHNTSHCKGKPCAFCLEWGHYSHVCPNAWKCYNCNLTTHTTNECPQACMNLNCWHGSHQSCQFTPQNPNIKCRLLTGVVRILPPTWSQSDHLPRLNTHSRITGPTNNQRAKHVLTPSHYTYLAFLAPLI